MPTDSERVSLTLIDDGRRLLEQGDRPGALAHFVTATQLYPDDEMLWLLRAEATDDPHEAVECLERILEINPDNKHAKEKLVYYQLNSMQADVRETNDLQNTSPLNQGLTRFGLLIVGFGLFFCILSAIAVAGYIFFSSDNSASRSTPQASSNTNAIPFPPTWTPPPSRTPLPPFTPITRASWLIMRDTTVRAGPNTTSEKLGTLTQGSTVYIIARTKDNKFLQIEYADTTKTAWIPTDSVEIDGNTLAEITIATNLPTTPTAMPRVAISSVPTPAKPANTPTPAFEFGLNRPPQIIADCNKQTGVLGTVYSANFQPMNGLIVRIWAFGQLQTTLTSGGKNGAGTWEWYFNNNSEVLGQVALVNSDGTFRSQSIDFHLTPCAGPNPANQTVIDFIATH